MRPALLLIWAVLTTAAGLPRAAAAQTVDGSARFEIQTVGDSMFTFAVGSRRWVAPRQRGIAVDPARRDALVARFVVRRVEYGMATALITGETTRLNAGHVALLRPPPSRWYRERDFWWGLVTGVATGVAGALVFR